MTIRIVGAGLAGLIAAHAWPGAEVFERSARPEQGHKALLRFRAEQVSALTGIDFRRVTVRKALWSGGEFVQPNIAHANAYSAKVIGRVLNDRSIWHLDPVERWVAPEDFYARLIRNVGDRVQWGKDVSLPELTAQGHTVVSTIPLSHSLRMCGEEFGDDLTFQSASITVRRYRVIGCDVFQTIYFPQPGTPLYRASITGDLLIAESIGNEPDDGERQVLEYAFGLHRRLIPIETARQRFGKIAPIPDATRRALLLQLTERHGIYSLGRFATWRNILLDDLVHDIAVIKRLIEGDRYATKLVAAG